jgi:hypothetical protein
MSLDPALDQLSRDELVERARALGARRPEVMTRVELRDEIVRLSETDPLARRRSRGWLGVARDLVASVMDAGLNLPGAAAAIRGDARPAEETTGPPPVATLTLAEIYLAQGHIERALATLEEVLVAEPEHAAALALRERITTERSSAAARRRPVPPPEPSDDDDDGDEPVPAPAPFAPSLEQPSFVASVEAPEATRSPEMVPPTVEPVVAAASPAAAEPEPEAQPAPAPPPEPTGTIDASWTDAESSAVGSQPVPTLAAPPVLDDAEPEPAALAARPECALLACNGSIEGLYSLPPGTRGVVLRVAWFVPGHDGPSTGTLDVPVDPLHTRVALPLAPPGAHVRAALGTGAGASFQPLAVAWVYRAEASTLSVAFAPPEHESAFLRAEAQAIASA